MESNNPQPNMPPEEQFRQPGAYDHGKFRRWWSLHHALAYTVIALAVLAFGVVGANYEMMSKVSTTYQPVAHEVKNIDPTANWKTYTNSQYGFQIKIPQDWDSFPGVDGISFASADTTNSYNQSKKECNANPPCAPLLGIDMSFNNRDQSDSQTSLPAVTLGSNTWSVYEEHLDVTDVLIYQIKNNGKIYSFRYFSSNPAMLNQILSTFKFTTTSDGSVFCGGVGGLKCPTTGYICTQEGNYPDAGTICKLKQPNVTQ
jgi:hypothetical protein